MKTFFKFFAALTLAIAFSFPTVTRAINPFYQLDVRNVQISSPLVNNTLEFDIMITHTNLPQSGPFEFARGNYYFNFNPLIANGGTLTYSIVPNSTGFSNPNAAPTNPTISGNQLRLGFNPILGSGNGPIVSTLGTRVIRMRLTTTAPSFAAVPLNLLWRDTSYTEPTTLIYAYINGSIINVVAGGTLIINYPDPPLPVELSAFTSIINKNNVTLNWSTSAETNNSGFDVERSMVNGQWSIVGNVNGNGTTASSHIYSFTDLGLASGKYNYRLKQMDFNGNFEYYNLSSEINIGAPSNYSLSQNYPNPFNPSTTISYELPFDSKVNITIFDMTGREVSTAVNEFRTAGYYSINFNASNLSSGIYSYRITAESGDNHFTTTKKMILLK